MPPRLERVVAALLRRACLRRLRARARRRDPRARPTELASHRARRSLRRSASSSFVRRRSRRRHRGRQGARGLQPGDRRGLADHRSRRRAIFALLAALTLAELLRRFASTGQRGRGVPRPLRPDRDRHRLAGAGPRLERGRGGHRERALAAMSPLRPSSSISWSGSRSSSPRCSSRSRSATSSSTGTLGGETRIATILQANTGLRRRSLEQIGVLANGVGRIVLIIAAIMLALAPWGVEFGRPPAARCARRSSASRSATSRSRSPIVVAALLIFAIGFAVTRIIQRWLDTTFLPATDLDAGLRNSIRTAFGYLGIFVAAALAFSYLGLSLDRDRDRRRRALGRYRFRPAVDRQQLRLRPDPVVGAADPRRRPRRRRRRRGPCAPHQRALDRDRDLRPLDPDRAELEPDLGRRQEPRPQRPHRARDDLDQRAAQPGSGARRRAPGALRRHASGRAQGAAAARRRSRRSATPGSSSSSSPTSRT